MSVKVIGFLLSFVLISSLLYGMEDSFIDTQEIVVYTIPSIGGLGGKTDYIRSVLNQNIQVVHVGTPALFTDLGQECCLRWLRKALKGEARNVILWATSQGTATALIYLAETNNERIKAVILESALASGNSAIYQTATGPIMDLKFLTSIPGSYYFVPYFGAVACPGYRPAGPQAIFAVNHIQADIPILIIHSEEDKQLPFDGACALYYGLRINNHKNVYLISKKGRLHLNLLQKESEKNIVRAILEAEFTSRSNNELAKFQPNYKQFKSLYDELIRKENNHRRIENAIVCGLICCLFTL